MWGHCLGQRTRSNSQTQNIHYSEMLKFTSGSRMTSMDLFMYQKKQTYVTHKNHAFMYTLTCFSHPAHSHNIRTHCATLPCPNYPNRWIRSLSSYLEGIVSVSIQCVTEDVFYTWNIRLTLWPFRVTSALRTSSSHTLKHAYEHMRVHISVARACWQQITFWDDNLYLLK